MGLGFLDPGEDEKYLRNRDDIWFIRGNHDDPSVCQSHPRYLGDWGRHQFMFWVSGAWSIDQSLRIEGISWWRKEELNAEEGSRALEDYLAAKPRIMISHDGPASAFTQGGPMPLTAFRPSSTAKLLQAMFESHQPEFWLFGHHHESRDFTLGTTRFRCLDIGEELTLHFDDDGAVSCSGL